MLDCELASCHKPQTPPVNSRWCRAAKEPKPTEILIIRRPIANVGVNYVTISSYHARPSASTTLCGSGAVFSPRPTSFQFLLFPGWGFSEARCLLATGAGGFLPSGLFQTPVFNAVLIRSWAVECIATCCVGGCLLSSRVSPWSDDSGRRVWL